MKRVLTILFTTILSLSTLPGCEQPESDEPPSDRSTEEISAAFLGAIEVAFETYLDTGRETRTVCVGDVCGGCSYKLIPPSGSCWIALPNGKGCSGECTASGCHHVCW